MHVIRRKLATARRRWGEQGLQGVLDIVRRRAVGPLLPWIGRRVERRGNRLVRHGVAICVDIPSLDSAAKGAWAVMPYEAEEVAFVRRYLPRDLPVIELGACVGGLACVTNRLLARPEQHVVVEANPELLPALHRTRDWNSAQFEVVGAAVAYGVDEVVLRLSRDVRDTGIWVYDAVGEVTVPAVTLSALAERAGFERFSLICDIEGGEFDLLEAEGELLGERVGLLILEFHPWAVDEARAAAALAKLASLGFERVAQRRTTAVYRRPGGVTPSAPPA